MATSCKTGVLAALATGGLWSTLASAQVLTHTATSPTLDRWMYPFSFTPGTRTAAPAFGANLLDGFDDRDGQYVIGFDTDASIPAGLDLASYRVLTVTLTATVSNDLQFDYDPTPDALSTFLIPDTDLDPGRPLEVFACGYRNGFDLATWEETSPYGANPVVDPAQGSRHIFSAVFDSSGDVVDVSNSLKDQFDPAPMGLGITPDVIPGDPVPADTTFTFELDLCDPFHLNYVREALEFGRLNLVITSLVEASAIDGPPTGEPNYPVFYTRENAIAQILGLEPTIEIVVRVGSAGDYTGDGERNFFDVSAFLADFNAGARAADLNQDCELNFFDVSQFLQEFAG